MYAYTGYGASAPFIAGAAALAIKPQLPPLSAFSDKELIEMPYERIALLAIGKTQEPQYNSQLSYLGQFFASVGYAAVDAASGGLSPSQLLDKSTPALKQLFSTIVDAYVEVAGDVSGSITQLSAAAGPVFAVWAKMLGVGLDVIGALQAQNLAQSYKECHDVYRGLRYGSGGTGYGGAVMPTDIITYKLKPSGTPEPTSIGEAFEVLEWPHLKMWQALNPGALPPPMGPAPPPANAQFEDTKRLLKTIRLAIQKSYAVSGSDGGASLWPVYLDLMWSQFMPSSWRAGGGGKLSRISKTSFFDLFCRQMPPFHYYAAGSASGTLKYGRDGCCKYERRGFDGAWEILRKWDLTINPIYVQDQQKAAELRAYIDAALAKMRQKVSLNPAAIKSILLKAKKPGALALPKKVAPKLHPAVAAGAGAAAVALALLFL